MAGAQPPPPCLTPVHSLGPSGNVIPAGCPGGSPGSAPSPDTVHPNAASFSPCMQHPDIHPAWRMNPPRCGAPDGAPYSSALLPPHTQTPPTPSYTVVTIPCPDPPVGSPCRVPIFSMSSPAPSPFVHSPYSSSDVSWHSSRTDFHELSASVQPPFLSPSSHNCFPAAAGSLKGTPIQLAGAPRPACTWDTQAPHSHPCHPPAVAETGAASGQPCSNPQAEEGAQRSPPCSHPRPWKRLRARRSITTFACMQCHTRWHVCREKRAAPTPPSPPP
eukprot:GGOE01028041.1.p1 GENE.GGOE01028041.1~~GGOE01028041.1.p1  ORF type:complete len:274 (-),score=12.83 GGOE01028041.1:797-1618(-)